MKLLKKLPSPVLLFSWLAIAAAGVLGAAEKQPESVQVSIGTILASNQNDEMDAKLKGMEKQLKVLKYRSYRLLKTESQNVPWRGERVSLAPRACQPSGTSAITPTVITMLPR